MQHQLTGLFNAFHRGDARVGEMSDAMFRHETSVANHDFNHGSGSGGGGGTTCATCAACATVGRGPSGGKDFLLAFHGIGGLMGQDLREIQVSDNAHPRENGTVHWFAQGVGVAAGVDDRFGSGQQSRGQRVLAVGFRTPHQHTHLFLGQ